MNIMKSKNPESDIWLPITVRANIASWPSFYKSCILNLLQKKVIKKVLFKISLKREPYLNLELKVQYKKRKSIASLIDQNFKHFLSLQDCDSNELITNEENELIFMPFLTNTIQYGTAGKIDKSNKQLKACCSGINKSLLQDSDLSEEDVLITMFIIYDLISSHFIKEYNYDSDTLIDYLSDSDKIIDINLFEGLYQNENELLDRLHDDVQSLTILDDFPVFISLVRWLDKHQYLQKNLPLDSHHLKTSFVKLIKEVTGLIQISDFTKWSLIYAIRHSTYKTNLSLEEL